MSGFLVNEYWHLNSYRYVFYRFVVESFCARQLAKPCLMLDAGCGPTICSLSHVPKNASVIGVDLNPRNVVQSHKKAKQLGYDNFSFILASLTALPFRSGVFDLTVSVDVLEHVDHKKVALIEISRILKLHAELIGSTTNLQNPIMQFDTYFPNISKVLVQKFVSSEQYERAGRFSIRKLSHVLNEGLFNVCKITLVSFPPFEPWIYEFSKKKLNWYAYAWIVYDKITQHKPLVYLKEIIVFQAIKAPRNVLAEKNIKG
jgi:ubiquinone/menaquinone biosynthesis C-methylase UbiE